MLSPLAQDDIQIIRQELDRLLELDRQFGSGKFLRAFEYEFFSLLLDDFDSFSENGLYSLGTRGALDVNDPLNSIKTLDINLFEFFLRASFFDYFDFLDGKKIYLEGQLEFDSSVEDILAFVDSLPELEGKRYSLFTWNYPIPISKMYENKEERSEYPDEYPDYGFIVMFRKNEK